MTTASLYAAHLAERQRTTAAALADCGFDALLVSSGTPLSYFADDQDAPLHETPHFAHWLPLRGPHHLLLVRPGERPRLVRYAPEDYWYEEAPLGAPFWLEHFELREAASRERCWELAEPRGRVAYVGDEPEAALAAGVASDALNPAMLVARLDWERSAKSAYEVECIEEAARIAARGHRAARAAFESGDSELEIHLAYLAACACAEAELPYPSIVAHDEKGATLHYTGKRNRREGRVLLIDAGARHMGYCSDITRTWTRAGCDPLFRELVTRMDALQQELCARIVPGLAYAELHRAAHLLIGALLHEIGLLRLDGEAAFELGLTRPFFPHGLGHFLGIQVHDVAGRQSAPAGGTTPPPAHSPFLRTTRTIAEHQVFTIEPGLYFIEMLLREHRAGPSAKHVDWPLVERLRPFGGIRIEDDVLVTAAGHRNLSRPHLE